MGQDKELVTLTKLQILVGVIMSILIPTLTSVGANYKAHANIAERIDASKLESYKVFVQKDEMKEIRAKLDQMDGKLNRIEGYLSK